MMDMMGHLESGKRETINVLNGKKCSLMLLIVDQVQKGQKKNPPGLTQEFRAKLPSDQLDVYSAFTAG